MRPALVTSALSLVLLGLGCNRGDPSPRRVEQEPKASPAQSQPAPETKVLEAAGLRLKLPAGWRILASNDPNFGMAVGPSPQTTQIMSCTIELRRQGGVSLSPGAKPTNQSKPDDVPYRQGKLRGRIRELGGPTPDAVRVVHCQGPRRGDDWTELDEVLDALKPHADASLPAPLEADGPDALVELCTATPARKTQVCVRRASGAIYCGASEGDHLTRVAELPAATAIGCDGLFSCARSEAGELWCWEPETAPRKVEALGLIREIAGGCVVTEAGALQCRARGDAGPSLDGFAELLPFGEAEHAQRGVERVLLGTDAEHGCVIAEGALRCWDRNDHFALALDAAEGRAPQIVETLDEPEAITDLVALGQRVCVVRGGRTTCLADGKHYELDDCGGRACGCSLVGLAKLSCEHTPDGHIDARMFGRVGGIRAIDGACGLRQDGRVVCRGPITGELEDRPEITKLVTGESPGVLHVLSLVETQ